MAVEFSNNLTKRNYLWTAFKAECIARNGVMQYDNDISAYYIIWFYNGNEIFICNIWKDIVPDDLIANLGYDQDQNDLDKIDFENNYISTINHSLVKMAFSGVAAQAPAKGLGGFAPDPSNNPYQPNSDEVVSLYVDGEGSLVTRGAIVTDEGSIREDFTGTDINKLLTGTVTFTNGSDVITGVGTLFTQELNRDHYVKSSNDGYTFWLPILRAPTDTTAYLDGVYQGATYTGTADATRWLSYPFGDTPGDYSVESSKIVISSGVDSSGGYSIFRDGDYLPMFTTLVASLSQMIDNQNAFLGFRDDVVNPTMYCDIVFPGTDPTIILFRSAWNSDEQSSVVSLPSGLDVTQLLRYKIDVSADYCALTVNGVLVVRHDSHIPDPYTDMYLCGGVYNEGATSNTNLTIDSVFFSNQDQIQIASSFVSPISVITKEDQHSILGTLVTTSTTEDQVILSYTVPTGKVFYIIGYRIENASSINGSPIKIGKNTISSIPSSPGSIDNNLFRIINLASNSNTGEVDYGSNPRKLGVGGDVIKVTVTPSGSLSSTWYAALDFVLR